MRRRPLYLAAPGDVVELRRAAEARLDTAGTCNPAALIGEPGDTPHDLATMILYRACFRGANGAFLDGLGRVPVMPEPLARPVRLFVVPGLNFRRHPETGADGSLVAAICRRLGMDVTVLEPEPRGSTVANAALLLRQLRALSPRSAWVVTISKGTADFRAALGDLGGWPDWLAGWINLSGVFQGTPVADRITESRDLRSLLLRAIIAAGGRAARNIPELRTDAAIWQSPVQPPAPGRLLHVVGFPPSWTIEMRISHHYMWLSRHHGPNDGIIPLKECFAYPGRLVPVWGADHFMRTPDLARLIYRLARYVTDDPSDPMTFPLDQRRAWMETFV